MEHQHKDNSAFEDVSLLSHEIFVDERGSLSPLIDSRKLAALPNLLSFDIRQINSVKSNFGSIRGIHSSSPLWPQRKIIFCLDGEITDVLVDLCPLSKTFGSTQSYQLSAKLGLFLVLPACIGHSFQTTSTYSLVNYLLDKEYNQTYEININPLSKSLKIEWAKPYILSDKDSKAISFEDFKDKLFQ